MTAAVRITLAKNIVGALRSGHPWVYRDAAHSFAATPGDEADVVDPNGSFVARGFVDGGPIAARLLALRPEPLTGVIERRIARALALRDCVVPASTTAYRAVHGEGDRLAGLTCDVYGAYAVIKLDGEGAAAMRERYFAHLVPALRARGITGMLFREGRGEDKRAELVDGEVPEGLHRVTEHGMKLVADLYQGQKTGLFLDHREWRKRVRELSRGLRVLNLYGYTGGFSVGAGLGGAKHVTTVDVSAGAIELARATWAANELEASAHDAVAREVGPFLDDAHASGERYDLIVSDPPSFAPREDVLPQALRSYKELHSKCLKLLAPGGLYLAASCSSHVRQDAFEKTVFDAAGSGGRVLQILERGGAPADHPRLAAFPEGDYLKALIARVLD